MSHEAPRTLTANRPLLVLAPHLRWPALNGADVTHVELGHSLSKVLPGVDVVGASEVVSYREGTEYGRRTFPNRMRSRALAAARTLVRGSHYYLERFVTPAFRAEAIGHLADPAYGAVLHSYLTTSTVAQLPDGRPHLVWSHNDEYRWFQDLHNQSGNPLARRVAASSLRWLDRYMERHERHLVLLHVTEDDHAGWRSKRPRHRGRVVPIGASLRVATAPPRLAGSPLHLLFVGALSIRMNLDALAHFAERYWPVLRSGASDASVTVAGSAPLREVVDLCARQGWRLRPNVTEQQLDQLYEDATFSLLPFGYATGAKLKLLASLARGVPVLATAAVAAQSGLVIDPSLMSDDPSYWVGHALRVRDAGVSTDQRMRLRSLAEAHSWDASARLVVAAISDE